MADLNDIDNVAPADSLKAGADTLNTWRARLDELHQTLGLGSFTAVEVTQLQAIDTVTILNAQWGYLGTCTAAGGAILDDADASAQRTTLGLAIGTNVLAYDAGLSNLAGISMAADKFYYTTADNTHASATVTTFARSILDDTTEGIFKATVNLEIGTDVQAYDADLSAIAALAKTDGNFIVGNGSIWVAESGATARTSLGLGSMAIQAHGSVNIDGGTIGGVTLDGAIAGGDQTFTNVGNMTFAAGSILASGASNTDTLLLKANDTTCITLTTAATDQMDLAAVYSLVAINNLDIGSHTFTCAGLIDDTLTSGRVVFASSGGLLADDADMTFSTDTLTVKKLVLNDATTATTDMLTLTPGGAVDADAIWKGIYINGDALDPGGANAAIEGIYVDLSGVASATGLEMRGVYASVPIGLGYEALHIVGKIKLDNDESSLAAGETATGIDIIVLASGAGGGEYHAIDVATTGTSSATLAALGTHTGIDVIHQHTGTFISPTQAWTYDDSETSYAPATTAFGSAGTDVTIFADDDDAIFVGADAAFDEIEVILATAASVDIKPTFWYSKAASFQPFFPADDTEGFTQDGIIRFVGSDLTDFAAQSVNGVSKFYIKIVRTKNNINTDPIEDTIKTLAATECFWNSTGALQVVSIAVPTITTVTTFTAAGDIDIGAYDFRAQTLTADGLTSGRLVRAGTAGLLGDATVTESSGALGGITTLSCGAITSTGTLALGANSITMSGSIGVTGTRVTKGWFDDLECTNAIAADITGDAATCSGLAASATILATARTIGGVSFNGSANIVPNTITIADESADTECFVGYFTGATGGLQPKTGTNLTFNSNTGVLTATGFGGALTGNVTGNCSGSSGSCTGQAATVATITGLAPDTATTQATQGSITSIANLATVGTITSGTLSTGAVLADVTMTLGSDVDGDIYYRASNKLTRLGKGTGLHILRMNAGATAPEWAAGGAGTVDTSGTPVDDDYAKFTDADTIEGRSYSEVLSDIPALGTDGTAGRIIRGTRVHIENGTNADTIKCTVTSRWNGEAIAVTDNIAKNATTGDFWLAASGAYFKIEASGLSGNVLFAQVILAYNASTTEMLLQGYGYENDINIKFYSTTGGTAIDITDVIDTGELWLEVMHINSA